MSWQWNYGCMFPGSPAAPGQRQMETSSWVDPDGLFGAPYNIVEDNNNNNNNNNNNVCWQQKGIKIRFRSQNYMVQVSGLPMLHPDRDKWKHTMIH